ncbi:UNKNOWN [Stylonychia lemnae]|uniref:Uncharacterized protein n=1 Tax=Stylonychia lemnae TaxID=5949 RepID=A0A078A3A9_STYLE|nr:UNKNOWN [Stylonychia lemnae]|eukprot:CDW75993.1 UNKNOWN [Stylonychia lemnae]
MSNDELRAEVLKDQQKQEEKKQAQMQFIEQPIQQGQGKLITSGKAVHGTETNFISDLEVGDFLIIQNENTGKQERRKVNMVLSARSCGLEEPFSEDIIIKSEYLFQKKPKLREKVKHVEDVIAERLAKENAGFVGGLDQKNSEKESIMEFRVKVGDAYKTVKEKIKGDKSKEELLDMRVKKKTDKFCWF